MNESEILTMPRGHTADELRLARSLARRLELGELHVVWCERRARPRAAVPSGRPPVARALTALGSLLERLAVAAERLERRA